MRKFVGCSTVSSPGDEAAVDYKSRAYCASVYGFFFLGTLWAIVAFFFKHGPFHFFNAHAFRAVRPSPPVSR
jgi:hypothetical protein